MTAIIIPKGTPPATPASPPAPAAFSISRVDHDDEEGEAVDDVDVLEIGPGVETWSEADDDDAEAEDAIGV